MNTISHFEQGPSDGKPWWVELSAELGRRFDRIEEALARLLKQRPQASYTPEQFGLVVNRSAFQIRQHCNNGRLRATKTRSGAGRYFCWSLSHEELERYQREGLLPIGKK